jgi:hypothetical protein
LKGSKAIYQVKLAISSLNKIVAEMQFVTNCTAHNTHHSLKHFYNKIAEHIMKYFYSLIPQNCNFGKVWHRLPDDSPDGPKHLAAIIR